MLMYKLHKQIKPEKVFNNINVVRSIAIDLLIKMVYKGGLQL